MGKEHEFLLALRQGNAEQARKIMAKLKKAGPKKKVNVNVQDEQGYSALHHCASNGYTDLAKEIVDYGGVVMLGDNKGMSPLHLAAFSGQYEVALILLMRHADPNAASRTGDTPLHLAAQYGHHSVVESLLDNKANCNLLNVSGQTPLDLACQHGQSTVVHMLLKSGQCQPRAGVLQTPLHLAAKHGHVDCLRLLIQYGYSVNTPGLNGTCLHEAALYGKLEVVKFVIEAGADVMATNGQNLTPLDVVNQYTDPRSSQELKKILQDATYAAQRRAYYSHQQQGQIPQPANYHQQHHHQQQQQPQYASIPQQQPVSHKQQTVGASPQQQAYYQQQQHQIHSGGVKEPTHAPTVTSHHHHQQQQPHSYLNMQVQQDLAGDHGFSRERAPSVDAGMRRGVKAVGIGGNAEIAAQIASLATKRSFKRDSPTRTGNTGSFDDSVQMRTQRSNTIAGFHHTGAFQSSHNPPVFRPAPPPGEREPDSAYSTLANDSPIIHEVREGLRLSQHQPYSPTARTSITNSSSMNSISSDPDQAPSEFATMLQQGRGTLRHAATMQEGHPQGQPGHPQGQPGHPQGQAGGFADLIAQGKGTLKKAHTISEPESPSESASSGDNFTALILQGKDTLRRSKKVVEKPKQEEPEVSNELMAKLLRRQQKAMEADAEPQPPQSEPQDTQTEQNSGKEVSPEAVPEPVPAVSMVRRNSKSQTPPPVAPKHASPQQQPAKKGAPAPPPRLTPTLDTRRDMQTSQPGESGLVATTESSSHHEFQNVLLRKTKGKNGSLDSQNLSASDSDSSLTIQGSPPMEKKLGPVVAPKIATERRIESQESSHPALQPVPKVGTSVPAGDQQPGMQSRSEASIFGMTAGMRISAELPESPLVTDTHSSNRHSKDEKSIFSQVILKKKEQRESKQASLQASQTGQEQSNPGIVPTSSQPVSVQQPVQTSVQPPIQTSVQPAVQPTIQASVQPPAQIPVQPIVQASVQPSIQTTPSVLHSAPDPLTKTSTSGRSIAPTKEPSPPVAHKSADPIPSAQNPPAPSPPVSRGQMSVFEMSRTASHSQEVQQPHPQEVRKSSTTSAPVTTVPATQPSAVHESRPQVTPPSVDTPTSPTVSSMPEWLTSMKLTDYVDLFVQEGFNTTDFVIGLTAEELIGLGMSKIGHRKRFLAALQSLPSEDVQPKYKPRDVSEWLKHIGLLEYQSAMVDAGYDEIEYMTDITESDLKDIGITKKGHLRKLLKSIEKLNSLPEGSGQPRAAVMGVGSSPSLTHSVQPPTGKEISPVPSAVDKAKQMISQASSSSSLDKDEAYGSEDSIAKSTGSAEHDLVAQMRKKSFTSASSRSPGSSVSQERGGHQRPVSGGLEVDDEFTMSDITGVLDDALNMQRQPLPQETEDSKTDDLMCELDDMLANLTSQIDIIIPGGGR